MEDLFLRFDIPSSPIKFSYGERVLFLGSCFSDEMADRAKFSGFTCETNPLGTVFHPEPIRRFLEHVLKQETYHELLVRNERWYSWDASTVFSSDSPDKLGLTLQNIYTEWLSFLQNSKILFVTFGTAWGYHRKANLKIVANCHRQSISKFEKRLSDSEAISESWIQIIRKLRALNPELTIVFTVSPVRHVRDGLVENNRSKAILIDAIRKICDQTGAGYFPSYEILMDQLRDYRFFKTDRVHPSEEAVSIIWQKLLECYTESETRSKVKHVESFRKFSSHVPSDFNAFEHQNELEHRKNELLLLIPDLVLK
ncbi:MAG: GSCFA domain-containing protein [Cryomorphaceae bacterium]|nr:GSCFA domain-containing protein [Cryomorphaceae bacterium]